MKRRKVYVFGKGDTARLHLKVNSVGVLTVEGKVNPRFISSDLAYKVSRSDLLAIVRQIRCQFDQLENLIANDRLDDFEQSVQQAFADGEPPW